MTAPEQRFVRAMIVAGVVLGTALAVDVWLIPVSVLTPYASHQPLMPLYGFWIPAISPRLLGPVVAHALYLVWVWFTTRGQVAARWVVPVQALWLAVLAVSLALVRVPLGELGQSMEVYPGEEFWDDVPKVGTPAKFLDNFTDMQLRRRLSLHGVTHPPGHTLYLWGVHRLFGGGTHVAALAVLAAGCSAVWPICRAVRRLFGDRVAERVVMLLPLVPSVAIFAVSSMDFLFLAAASWSFWLAVEAVLSRRGTMAFVAGVVAAAAAMFSFAHGFVGMIVGLWAVAVWIDREGTVVPRQLAWMAAGLLCSYAVLRWGVGYDWFESIALTHRFHRYVIAAEFGRSSFAMWAYMSAGNLLAFSWYLGVPTVAGAALSFFDAFRAGMWCGGLDRQVVRALGAVLALKVLGGLFPFEVERIWLYQVPLVLAAACSVLPSDLPVERERGWRVTVGAIMAAQCIAYEATLFTLW